MSEFTVRNLSVLSYVQGFTMWHYKAPTQTLDEVTAVGFFDGAVQLVNPGDMIIISCKDGGTIRVVHLANTVLNYVMVSQMR